MRQLFKAYVFLAILLLGCQSNDNKAPLIHKQDKMNSQQGILEFFADALVISSCKSSGQYNLVMSARLRNNTNDTIIIPSSKHTTSNDNMTVSPSYIEGTLYGQRVRLCQRNSGKQISPHSDVVLELFLENFKPAPQGIYVSDFVICGDSIRSMLLDYVYKPSINDKLNTCLNIHFHSMQNTALIVAPSNLAISQMSQCFKTISELFEDLPSPKGQMNIKYEKSNWDCSDNGMVDCHVGKVFVSAQEQQGLYNLAISTVVWNNSCDTVWLPMRKDVAYQEAGDSDVSYFNSVLLEKTAKISIWSRTNYVPPYGMVRVAFFLKDYDAAKSKCSNDKTLSEDGLRTMRLIYHYHPLSVDDSRMCKGIDFHVGQRTSLVVVPNNLRCGEIPLLYQKVHKGEPIDY